MPVLKRLDHEPREEFEEDIAAVMKLREGESFPERCQGGEWGLVRERRVVN